MANGIDNYNRGDRRNDLTNVGQKIKALSGASDSTILDGLVGLSLQIAQNAYIDKKSESRTSLVSALTGTASAVKALDHTQSGTEITDASGNVYDPYDRQYKLATTALDALKDFQDDPALKKQRPEINQAINEFAEVIAHKDAMKNQREGYLDNLESLGNEYMDLVKSDPSMTDPDDWSNATDIIKDLELGYANLLSNSGKKIPAEKALKYQDLIETHDLLGRAIEGDMNKNLEGFQVDLTDKGSPYLQSFFKKMGMEQMDPDRVLKGLPQQTIDEEGNIIETSGDMVTPEGQATYLPPSEFGPYISGRIYETPDTDLYAEANAAFNKWQNIQTELEAQNLVYEQTAEERRPLEIMRDWMEAPGDIAQAKGADVIAFQLFGDTDKTFEQNISDLDEGPYKDNLIAKYTQLSKLKAEGKHAAAFDKMQTTYNKKHKATSKLKGLTIDQVAFDLASAMRSTATSTNNQLNTYNAQFDKDDPRRIPDIPAFVEKTIGATTIESKIQHIESMNKLLKRANAGEWTAGNEPGGEIKLIRDYETAEGEAKWVAIQKLVDTYLTPSGSRLLDKEEEIREAFDADYMGGKREENEVELFYALLRSWQAISNADPQGTTVKTLLDILTK